MLARVRLRCGVVTNVEDDDDKGLLVYVAAGEVEFLECTARKGEELRREKQDWARVLLANSNAGAASADDDDEGAGEDSRYQQRETSVSGVKRRHHC